MARETINGISVPIPGTGEPADFVGDLRQIATDLSASTAQITEIPVFYDDFTDEANVADIAGRVSDSGHTWLSTGGEPLGIYDGALSRDPTNAGLASSGYASVDWQEVAGEAAPTYVRMVGEYVTEGGTVGTGGGALLISDVQPPFADDLPVGGAVLHQILTHRRFDIGISKNYPTRTFVSQLAVTQQRTVMATFTSGSTDVVIKNGKIDPLQVAVAATSDAIPGGTTFTYTNDKNGTLSAAATASGTYLLTLDSPQATDGSVTYRVEWTADAETGLVTFTAPDGQIYSTTVAPERFAATTTSTSATVTCASILSTHQGMKVSGAGIPADTYVGDVTAATSFKLSSSPTSQVDVTATATGAVTITVGSPLSEYLGRYLSWETQGSRYPFRRWLRVGLFTRRAVVGNRAQEALERNLGADVVAQPGRATGQVRMGRVPNKFANSLLAGLAFGSSEDANLYRRGPARLGTDGTLAADALAVKVVAHAASATLAADGDGAIVANTAGITLTLPLAGSTAEGRVYFIRNMSTGSVTVARSGSDTFEGSATSITIRAGDAVTLIGNGNDTWWRFGHYAPALPGIPTPAAAAGAGTSPPSPAIVAGSTDEKGVVRFGTGTTPAAGQVVTVAFSATLSPAPIGVLLTGNTSSIFRPFCAAVSATGFTVNSDIALAASQPLGQYAFAYQLIRP